MKNLKFLFFTLFLLPLTNCSSNSVIIQQDNPKMVVFERNFDNQSLSSIGSNIIVFHENKDATIECKLSGNITFYQGESIVDKEYKVGERIQYSMNIPSGKDNEKDYGYIDLTIKYESYIIAYSVIQVSSGKVFKNDNSIYYTQHRLCSISFPKVNDSYQNISKEYIEEQMNIIKKEYK